jgi:5-methylthioadenosine/S-adenosylhomocysteine deaminase
MNRADILVRNGTILTMDGENTVIPEGSLTISEDTIRFVGSNNEAPMDAEKVLDAEGGLILPGLINSHTHAAMTLFRGLADDLPLMDWLNGYVFPVESRMNAEFVRIGTLLACAEMIMSGTTTFCDMYLFEDEAAHAAREAGMRCLVGEVLYDFPSPNYGPIEDGLRYTESLIQEWGDDPLVSIAVEPHSLYTCSPDLLTASNALSLEYHVPLIIHVAETLSEIAEVKKKYGKGPIEHLHSMGILGPHLIADHCVYLNERDIERIAEYGVKAVDNPESNMKLASGISPVPEMLTAGVTVGLGTDGCASNNNLDLFGEMDMAAKCHKIKNLDPTVMNALSVVRMATIEGAKVLGIDTATGSLEVGKKADIIVLDMDKPHLTPMYNPFSHLVYVVSGHDVRHTIINGSVVMENRILRTLDITEVMAKANEKALKVRDWVKK